MSELTPGEHADPNTASPSDDVPLEEPKYDNFYSPKNVDFYSKFQYSNLDTTERHIRLLRIHPPERADDTKAQIKCDLLDNISLEDMEGKYTTISYCAGDPKKAETISVNGLEFNAFANLGHALRQARHFWADRFNNNQELLLWADQVCINQSNTLERSRQVGFMGAIYATAKQVLVSLSQEGDATGDLGWLQIPTIEGNLGDADSLRNFVQKWILEGDFHIGFNAFSATVLESRWWSRAWVRQEFILSPEAYFMASFEYMQWRNLTDRLPFSCFTDYPEDMPDIAYDTYSDCKIQDCRACTAITNGWKEVAPFGIEEEIYRLKFDKRLRRGPDLTRYISRSLFWCEASDPRDLIYAFFAISTNNFGIKPDYSKDCQLRHLLVDLGRAIFSDMGAQVLEYAGQNRNRYLGLASWVPRWGLEKHLEISQTSQWLQPPILEARGVFHGVLSSYDETDQSFCFQASGHRVIISAWEARAGDEVWMLEGARCLLIFRRDGLYHEYVEEAVARRFLEGLELVALLLKELAALIEENSPLIQKINIC